MKKTFALILALTTINAMALPTFAASHAPYAPTQLTLSQPYQSNAYYGDEYYTFTIDSKSDVNIHLGSVAINHTYIMTLSGEDITPISTSDSSYNDELTLDDVLEPGIYYIDVDSDFNGLARTDPDETWYNILVTAVPF